MKRTLSEPEIRASLENWGPKPAQKQRGEVWASWAGWDNPQRTVFRVKLWFYWETAKTTTANIYLISLLEAEILVGGLHLMLDWLEIKMMHDISKMVWDQAMKDYPRSYDEDMKADGRCN